MKYLLAVILLTLQSTSHCQDILNPPTDILIKEKINSLVLDILSKQTPDGTWRYGSRTVGSTSLHLLALASAGIKEKHPAIQKGVNYLLKNFPEKDTYSMGLYAAALQKINQEKYKVEISNAASWLVEAQKIGTWNYTGSGPGDNSVTQFALLGIKAALEAGINIPQNSLEASKNHFLKTQNDNGGWGYSNNSQPTASMTSAALASLAVCKLEEEISLELLKGPQFCGSYQINPNIRKGLIWLHKTITKNSQTIFGDTYAAYSLERAGIFFDKKKIGKYDWFKIGANNIINSQNNKGKYLPEAFKLLFLAKGNTPILLNKAAWGKTNDWNRRRRDTRNMVRQLSKTLNQQLDWQAVRLNLEDPQFGQAPIFYISGLYEFTLSETERVALKSFIEDGGTVLFSPCLRSKPFITSVLKEMQKIYPRGKFTDPPKTHPLRRMYYNLQNLKIPLKVLKNNCVNKNIFITTSDLSLEYEAQKVHKISKYTLVNLAKYSLKEKPLIAKMGFKNVAKAKINNLKKLDFQNSSGTSEEGLEITQIIYGNNLDKINPDPMNNALGYMRQSLKIPTKAGINLISLQDYEKLIKLPVIYMTGEKEINLSKVEKNNLKRYIENGGFLFADSTCSCSEFRLNFKRLMIELFPENKLAEIPLNSPVYQQPFKHDISFSKELSLQYDPDKAFLLGLRQHSRYSVIYSPFDFSSSLTGEIDEQAMGLKTISSLKLITNIVSYGLSF